jgi:hypothetical protein
MDGVTIVTWLDLPGFGALLVAGKISDLLKQ